MSKPFQSLLLGLVAVLLLRMSLTYEFLTYVKPVMRPWLVLSAVVLAGVALGLALVRRKAATGVSAEAGDAHCSTGGEEHGPPRLAWLLALPLAAVFIVAPEPLGLYAASRQASWTPQAPAEGSSFPRMRSPIEGAHEMGLNEFNLRAYFDEAQSLADRRVRLTGFVRHDPAGPAGEVLLTRFVVACCAADGMPVSVRLAGLDGPPPAEGTWLTVEGTWVPNPHDVSWTADADDTSWAALEVDEARPVPQPREPYEEL